MNGEGGWFASGKGEVKGMEVGKQEEAVSFKVGRGVQMKDSVHSFIHSFSRHSLCSRQAEEDNSRH